MRIRIHAVQDFSHVSAFLVVLVIGDGTQAPKTVTGDALHDFDKLVQVGRQFQVEKAISQSKPALLKRLFELEEGGATALGPAVAVALGMAEQVPGASIVIATDGVSNTGVGAMDGKRSEIEMQIVGEFFSSVGRHAKEKSNIINIVSIRGEEVNMSLLGQMASATDGSVSIVDPHKLREEFAGMLQAKLIATAVTAKLIVHRGLKLANAENVEGADSSVTTKSFGSVYEDTEATFEYEIKSKDELERLLGAADAQGNRHLPFQVQITYSRLNGMKCVRVITRTQQATQDRQQAEADLNAEILGQHVWARSAALAQRGDYNAAVANNEAAQEMMARQPQQQPNYGHFQQVSSAFTAQLSKAQAKYQPMPAQSALPAPAPGAYPGYGAIPSPAGYPPQSAVAENPLYSPAEEAGVNPLFQQDDETFGDVYQFSRARNMMKKK